MSTSHRTKPRSVPGDPQSDDALQMIKQSPRVRRKGRGWLVGLGLGAVVVAVAAIASNPWARGGNGSDLRFQTYEVARGSLEITVVEQGNLESTSNIDVRCEVEGGRVGGGGGGSSGPGTQIIWLYKEGEFVKKGEKLVELDPSGLKQQDIEQQIAYETARQALITSKNTFEAAKIAVDEYRQGTYPKEVELVDAEITVAKENLRRAEEYARYSEKLYQKGFVTQLSLEADQFAVENARLVLKAAETKKSSLVEFTQRKMIADLESLRDSAEASMKAAEAKFSLEENKLQQIRDQLEKCTIYAPRDGMVIYASDRDRRGRSDSVEIKEGALVRLRQIIIQLPDLQRMQVKAKVHESVIERVKRGQTVHIRIDALPNLTLHGQVQTINNQPEPGSWYSSNVKDYGVSISIDETVDNLKPGMTAEVEIQIDHLDNALMVPVQAVVQKGDKSFCYLADGSGIQERPVVLGDTNDVLIEIKDGLSEGEQVILNPRAVVPEARDAALATLPKKQSSEPLEQADRQPWPGEPAGIPGDGDSQPKSKRKKQREAMDTP